MGSCVHGSEPLVSIKGGEITDRVTISFSRWILLHAVSQLLKHDLEIIQATDCFHIKISTVERYIHYYIPISSMSRDSSVNIVKGTDWMVGLQFQMHPVFIPVGTGALSLGMKWPEREPNPLPPSLVDVTHACSFTYILQYVSVTQYFGTGAT